MFLENGANYREARKFDSLGVRQTMCHQLQYGGLVSTGKSSNIGAFVGYKRKIEFLRLKGLEYRSIDRLPTWQVGDGEDGVGGQISWKLGGRRVEIGDSPCNTTRVFRTEDVGGRGWF